MSPGRHGERSRSSSRFSIETKQPITAVPARHPEAPPLSTAFPPQAPGPQNQQSPGVGGVGSTEEGGAGAGAEEERNGNQNTRCCNPGMFHSSPVPTAWQEAGRRSREGGEKGKEGGGADCWSRKTSSSLPFPSISLSLRGPARLRLRSRWLRLQPADATSAIPPLAVRTKRDQESRPGLPRTSSKRKKKKTISPSPASTTRRDSTNAGIPHKKHRQTSALLSIYNQQDLGFRGFSHH
ncbi:hypothetical protein JZ751_021089 [Albula glossodonta]|uniref:Uncharacterized protein n=1 Tax=Albula glossodonta TaxID=121402 RepID=A0A8T2PJH8_9TELE|nr:hypothetical protein JZ751_021089 [Albula glossodonta]